MKRFKTVDEFISASGKWTESLIILRDIILKTDLEETVKWGAPVYTINGKNIVGLGAFKSYVGLWFFQGVFLKDKSKKLFNAQNGKTKALRQWRFNSADEIDDKLVLQYVKEAIKNQKDGKEIKPEKKKSIQLPDELNSVFKKSKSIKRSFKELTPYKQREYAEYISTAKRGETKQKRLEKIIPMIEAKIGLNDKYKC